MFKKSAETGKHTNRRLEYPEVSLVGFRSRGKAVVALVTHQAVQLKSKRQF